MRRTSKLQKKVFAIFGSFTLLLCLVFFAICLLAAYVIEDHIVDNLLEGEVRYIEQQAQITGFPPEPRLPYLKLYSKGQPIPLQLRSALPDHAEKAEWFSDSDHHFHLQRVHFPDNSSAILAAEVSELITVTRQSARLLWLFGSACTFTVLLALYCAYGISRKTIAPVIALAEAVKQQRSCDALVSLPHSGDKDEIGYLAYTLESTINQLKQALQREAEFTRDTSHEFRTALTILKGTLTLSQNRTMTASEKTELLQTVTGMEKTVMTLLALARSESLQPEPFWLRPLLEERLLKQHQILIHKNFQIQLEVESDREILANRHLVSLLFDNLIGNALQHASKPELRIHTKRSAIFFENPIETALDTKKTLLSGQKREGSKGIGQGLFLATRICTALGWTMALQCQQNTYRCELRLRTERSIQQSIC
ncbi:HAMP domain-containing sensor histidine kinase [Microbulbifer spongiae]|uniref:histidine kinase n=1 Tax=Microbulbifer spongiae TaxID=2944933 RepID=A0ABY9EB21_9GAMM|nr:HAMP domain-containing sensor histidine kinase [Microbulbifer sp. MI-G]WKD50203.1 HAMP domain-containing histidine kinase [Microbulbifer sp. MI-G]